MRLSKYHILAILTLLLLLPAIFINACSSAGEGPYRATAEVMGTTFSVTIDGYADSSRAAEAAFEEIRRIDRLLSTYKEDSEISKVNREASSGPVFVGEDFWNVVTASRDYYELSEGRFDPTIYPLMRMWGFVRRQGRIPTDEELADALPLVDFGKVKLDEKTHAISFGREGMALDFGGIAKGYAVDKAMDVLRDMGVKSAIIDAGGNFYALGIPSGRESWLAGVRHPLSRDKIIARLPISDKAMATSGDYERFFEIDGRKYCHIMDPLTGRPIEGMLSATIIADTAVRADALSTAVFVLGAEKGIQLIESLPGVEVMLIAQDTDAPDKFRIILSTGLINKVDLLF